MKEDLFLTKLRDAGFDLNQRLLIKELIEKTCTNCWDSVRPCTCMKDE